MGHVVGSLVSRSVALGGVPGVASTIIFADGADHVSSGVIKWPDGSDPPTAAPTGAHGSAYDHSSLAGTYNINQNLADLSAGARYRFRVDATSLILLFSDTSANVQVGLQYIAGGRIAVVRGPSSTVLDQTAAGVISLDTWYYVELGATINNTTGSVTAKIYDDSGTLLDTLTFSGDTQNTANAFANHFIIGGSANDAYAEDIWLASTSALYGPLRVETLYPDGAGNSAQCARGGADSGANWSQCDETINNGTTDYVIADNANDIDLYTFQNGGLAGAIHAVQVMPAVARAAAAGPTTSRAVVRIGGTNYFGTTHTLTTNAPTFRARGHCWGTSPATGLAWTEAELASAEFGFQGVTLTVNVHCTQVAVEVVRAI